MWKWIALAVAVALGGCEKPKEAAPPLTAEQKARVRSVVESMSPPSSKSSASTATDADTDIGLLEIRIEEIGDRSAADDALLSDRLDDAEKRINLLELELSTLESRLSR
jgi:hypothetical protein